MLTNLLVLALAIHLPTALGQGASSAPFPNAVYPGAVNPYAAPGAQSYQGSPPYYPSPWIGGEKSTDKWTTAMQRAQALVSQLTLAEKVNLTTGVGWESDQCVGNTGSVPRLGIRSLCLQDSPLAVRYGDFSTLFPAGVTAAASWDRDVCYQRGRGMGQEFYGKGVDLQLGPVVGPLGRAPEGGRNWEGFSPDPVLSGVCVAQTVKGIQDSGVIATTKHYIGNEQEHFRGGSSSNIDDATMHELYLWPFSDAVRAGTGSIMCSYNQINSSYSCQNSHSLNGLLKAELGFQGFVMTDWSGQHSGVSSILAGLDMTMPGDIGFDSGNSYWGGNLTIAVLNGSVPEWRLDDAVTRVLTAWYYVGRGDVTPPDPNFSSWTLATAGNRFFESGTGFESNLNQHINVQGNHAAQVRSQAARGTVLLKNTNNTLPLTGQEKFLAIIGEDARTNINGPNDYVHCSDHGCDIGTMAVGWGSGTGFFPFLVDPLTAITNYAVNKGTGDVQAVTNNYDARVIQATASQASTAIVFVNTDGGEGYITVDGNAGDRNNLTLWQGGEALINNVTAVCSNVIVVVHSIGPVLLGSWNANPNVTAIVWANVPGEQSGNALVDVLYGSVNPGGKLPYTLGAARADYGTDLLYLSNAMNGTLPQLNFQEGILIDYRYFDAKNITPIYEFGYGLSYTTFSFSNIQVQANGHGPYTPNTGNTSPAPSLGTAGQATSYVFPAGFTQLRRFIYSFINSTNLAQASGDLKYGLNASSYLPPQATNGSAQPVHPAGGAPGGNPRLYDIMFTVTATLTNTGSVAGDEVAQLYVSLGGPADAPRVLRDFRRVHLTPGQSKTVSLQLTRRDISSWDINSQNWVVTNYPKTVYVGNSSRKLPLSASLPLTNVNGTQSGARQTQTIDVNAAVVSQVL